MCRGDVLCPDAPATAARKMPVDQRRRLIFATGPSVLSALTVDTLTYITPVEIYTPDTQSAPSSSSQIMDRLLEYGQGGPK